MNLSPSSRWLTSLSTSCPKIILEQNGDTVLEKMHPKFDVFNQICLWTVWVVFPLWSSQSLMSPLEWGPRLNTVSLPLLYQWRILSGTLDSKGCLAEECAEVLPVQGPLLTAVLSPVTSTRPLSFYPHFLLHLPEVFIFLCSGYRLWLQDVLCSCLLSIAFPPGVLWLLRPTIPLWRSVFFLVPPSCPLQVGVPHPLTVYLREAVSVLASNSPPTLLYHP